MTITTHTTINLPGLNTWVITVSAESTAEPYQHDGWYGLTVDGRHYDLVMWKHTIGRPQHMAALDQALAQVQAAIDGLKTPPTPPDHTINLVDGLWELTIDGLYHSRHDRQVDAETARDEYRHYQLTHRSPKELMDLFGAAYRTAKADGRLLDAARYRQSFDAAFAAHLGLSVEQMRIERDQCRDERKAA